jgi:hypothetical protein
LNVSQDARGAITVILVFLVITKGGSKGPPFSNGVAKNDSSDEIRAAILA